MYGREDCTTSPDTDALRPFPSGHLDADGVFSFFAEQYGMDVEESVAILGGHTLGRATGFLGWHGIWVEEEAPGEEIEFDNEYFVSLVDPEIVFGQVQNEDHMGCATIKSYVVSHELIILYGT